MKRFLPLLIFVLALLWLASSWLPHKSAPNEVDLAGFGLQHLEVVRVDARGREIPAGGGPSRLVAVHDCSYLKIARVDAAFRVNGRVALSSNEAVSDKGAT